jgi:hypothetical protein
MAGGQKYEREIAEILERLERDEPKGERVRRQARQAAVQRRQSLQDRFSGLRGLNRQFGAAAGWAWIGVTLGIGILGLILRGIHPLLGVICAVLMVLSFFSPLLGRFGSAPSPAPSNMWRGQVVELRPRGFLANLRFRWRRFRSGGGPFR